MSLDEETAWALLRRGREAAGALGVPMALAVVDAAGVAIATTRMDDATPIAARTVVAKARTAVHFGRPTAEVVESARRSPVVYSSFLVAAPDLVLSMGGVPIRAGDGTIIGGFAASGGLGEEDVQVAEAALEGLDR